MQLTEKHSVYFRIAGFLLAILYFGPSVLTHLRHAFFSRSPIQPSYQKPNASRPYLPAVTASTETRFPSPDVTHTPAPTSAAPTNGDPFSKLTGKWEGAGAQLDEGICRLDLQIRANVDQPGGYTGYSTMFCTPSTALIARMAKEHSTALTYTMIPTSEILSGTVVNGELRFHVDKNIGTPFNGCAITGLTLTPFGTSQIAAEWQRGSCRPGQIVMGRSTSITA